MKDYLAKFKDKDIESISIVFYFQDGKAAELGKKLSLQNEPFPNQGLMWDKIITQYIKENDSEVFAQMDTDPEPTMHTTYFEISKENEVLAKRYISLIEDLIEQEEKALAIYKTS